MAKEGIDLKSDRSGRRISEASRIAMAYSDKVIDHYENPRNVGTLDKNDPNVGTGLVGAPACGDVMRLQIKISDDGIIEDAKFKTFGCGSAIASQLAGHRVGEGQVGGRGDAASRTREIAQELSLPAGEDPLLGAGRGRDQGRDRGLQAQAARPSRTAASGRDSRDRRTVT